MTQVIEIALLKEDWLGLASILNGVTHGCRSDQQLIDDFKQLVADSIEQQDRLDKQPEQETPIGVTVPYDDDVFDLAASIILSNARAVMAASVSAGREVRCVEFPCRDATQGDFSITVRFEGGDRPADAEAGPAPKSAAVVLSESILECRKLISELKDRCLVLEQRVWELEGHTQRETQSMLRKQLENWGQQIEALVPDESETKELA